MNIRMWITAVLGYCALSVAALAATPAIIVVREQSASVVEVTIPGPQGPAGFSELNHRGEWSVYTPYTALDTVIYQGSRWIAIVDNTGVTPAEGVTWTLLAGKGDVGPEGPAGPQGIQGIQGPAGPAGTTDHSQLTNMQGGTTGQYYHMTQTQNTQLHNHSNKVSIDKISESGGQPLWNGGPWPGSSSGGDMYASTYDANANNVVDAAESVAWDAVTNKPSTFTPSSHLHPSSQINDFAAGVAATTSVQAVTSHAADNTIHLSSGQKTDLTDSGDSTAHYHAADRNVDNHVSGTTNKVFTTQNQTDVAANTSARHTRGHTTTSATDHTDWPAGLDVTELGYVNGVTSGIQTQLNAKEPALGNPGVNGMILTSTTGGTRSWVSIPGGGDMLKSTYDVSPQDGVVDTAASVAWTGVTGKPSTFSAAAHGNEKHTSTFVDAAGASAAAPVQSVAGRTGAVTLSTSDVSGLGAAATKGVSGSGSNVATVTGTLTSSKQATFDANGNLVASAYDVGVGGVTSVNGQNGAVTITAAGLGAVTGVNTAKVSLQPNEPSTPAVGDLWLDTDDAESAYGVSTFNSRNGAVVPQAGDYTKSMVGLANVDNTSDANKPISTLTQVAIDLKAPLSSPALTGVPTAPTAAEGTNTTQIATTAYVDRHIADTTAAHAASAIGFTPTGSIEATTVQAMGAELASEKAAVSVGKWYSFADSGAAGDGTTDDYSVLNAWLNALPDGAIVYGDGRTYKLDTALGIRNNSITMIGNENTTFKGAGSLVDVSPSARATYNSISVTFTAGVNSITIPGGVTINAGEILYAKASSAYYANYYYGVFVKVTHVDGSTAYLEAPPLKGFTATSIVMYYPMDYVHIEGFIFDNTSVAAAGTTQQALKVSANRIRVKNNQFKGNQYAALATNLMGSNVEVDGNKIRDYHNSLGDGGTGRTGYGVAVSGSGIDIHDNSITNCKHAISSANRNIYTGTIRVTNNTIHQDIDYYNTLDTYSTPYWQSALDMHASVDNVIFEKNTVVAPSELYTYGGIFGIRNGSAQIDGNKITITAGDTGAPLISVAETALANIRLTGNVVDVSAVTTPILVYPDTTDRATLTFSGNTLTGFDYRGYTVADDRLIGAAAPVAGVWAQNAYIENNDQDAGDPIGWRCVVAGTPGTWEAVYPLAAAPGAAALKGVSGNGSNVATVSGTLTPGKQATFNADGNVIASSYDVGVVGGSTTFAGLTDAFALTGNGGKVVQVNAGGTALEPGQALGTTSTATFGGVNIGTDATVTALHVRTNGTPSPTIVSERIQTSSSAAGAFLTRHANGTLGSPTKLTAGDYLGTFSFAGWHNGGTPGYVNGAQLVAAAAETPSDGVSQIKTHFIFFTNNGTAIAERMRLTGDGSLGIGTTTPENALDINSATGANLQLTYNDSNGSAVNKVNFAVSSSGDLTVTPSGGDMTVAGVLTTTNMMTKTVTLSDNVSTELFRASASDTTNASYAFKVDYLFVAFNGTDQQSYTGTTHMLNTWDESGSITQTNSTATNTANANSSGTMTCTFGRSNSSAAMIQSVTCDTDLTGATVTGYITVHPLNTAITTLQ